MVSVRDQDGAAFPGAVVTFAVLGDGGTLSAVSDTTDAEGRAATTLTLGEELGADTVFLLPDLLSQKADGAVDPFSSAVESKYGLLYRHIPLEWSPPSSSS